jgi:protein TonB
LLDDTTCRLGEKRFRYRPARDAEGSPIESTETTNFTWGTRAR